MVSGEPFSIHVSQRTEVIMSVVLASLVYLTLARGEPGSAEQLVGEVSPLAPW